MSGKPERFYTPNQVGRLLQMDASSILRWVHEGILPAYSTPGGHRRIKQVELVSFLREHNMYVPPELQPRRKVLLVDEDPRRLEALQRAFEPHQAHVEAHGCAHAIDALVRLGELQPVAIVLSGRLSVDALEICRRLRLSPAYAKVELFVVCADSSADERARAAEVGARLLDHAADGAEGVVAAVLRAPGSARAAIPAVTAAWEAR